MTRSQNDKTTKHFHTWQGDSNYGFIATVLTNKPKIKNVVFLISWVSVLQASFVPKTIKNRSIRHTIGMFLQDHKQGNQFILR